MKAQMRYGQWVRVAASALFVAASAGAQVGSSAQALFDEGRRLMSEGKYAEACPKLAASQKIDPGAGTLMNLATCYERAGQRASAWATFKEAASAARTSGHPDWEKAARERIDALEPRLSRLTIVVPSDVAMAGLAVLRDGRAVEQAEWGIPIPVDAGTHAIEATAPSRVKWSSTVTFEGDGETKSVTIPMLTAEASPPALAVEAQPASSEGAPVSSTRPGATQRLVALSAVGLGAIGLGVGAAFGLMARSTHEDALTHCKPNLVCTSEGVRLGDKASGQAAVSTVAFTVGGVLAAAGAVLYFTAPSAPPAPRPPVALSVSPTWSPRGPGAAAMLGGAF